MSGDHNIRSSAAIATDVKTTERAEECKACGMFTTNSQPDCRCS